MARPRLHSERDVHPVGDSLGLHAPSSRLPPGGGLATTDAGHLGAGGTPERTATVTRGKGDATSVEVLVQPLRAFRRVDSGKVSGMQSPHAFHGWLRMTESDAAGNAQHRTASNRTRRSDSRLDPRTQVLPFQRRWVGTDVAALPGSRARDERGCRPGWESGGSLSLGPESFPLYGSVTAGRRGSSPAALPPGS